MNLGTVLKRVQSLEKRLAELEKKAAEAEQKRGPGRPPKETQNVG